MELKLLLYSAIAFLIALILHNGRIFDFTIMELLKTALPFSYKSWWFATIYMTLMLFSPYINRFLESCSQKEHIGLLITCFVLFNVIGSYSLDPIDNLNGYGITNFIFLYALGRYIRKYGLFNKIKKRQWFCLYAVFSILIFVSYLLYGNYKFGTYNSVLLCCSSVSLFMCISQIDMKAPIFSKIAPYTFSVYLISDHFFLREIINKVPMKAYTTFSGSWCVIFTVICYALVVLVGCVIVDYVITLILGKPLDTINEFICRICLKLQGIFTKYSKERKAIDNEKI